METHKVITELLAEAGIDTVFTLQSDGNMRMLAHMHGEWTDEFDLIKARHEQSAMAMADGFSRVSNELCLCTVGRGPAIAQTGTSLVTTRRRQSPFLILVPESATDESFDIKGFEQEEFLNTTLSNVISSRDHDTVLESLKEGVRRVAVGDGPVAVQIAGDVLDSDFGDPPGDGYELAPNLTEEDTWSTIHPDEAKVEEAVELFLESDATKAPVIIAGRGAVNSGAHDAIVSLAERMSALLATAVQGRGYFSDHPFSLGFVGHYGGNLANEYVMESDYVLAVGCSLNPYTTDSGHLFHDDKTLVHIDADPSAIEQYTRVDLGITADATAGVSALDAALEARDIDRSGEFWTDSLRDRIASDPVFDEDEFPDMPGTIDPRDLIGELNQLLPEERIVVTDTGHHTRWVLDGLETPSPNEFVWPSEFGSIGPGVPVGIGAALAAPEVPCVTVCGDAGFMMTAQEIETAARNDIPILVVVMNDEALGTEYHSLARYGDHADVSIIDTPAIADMATAMGADGDTIRSITDLEEAAATFTPNLAGPVVLDCRINRNVVHRSKM